MGLKPLSCRVVLRNQAVGLCGSFLGTHHVVESVGLAIQLASEEGAVVSCGLAPGPVEIIG